MLTQLAIQDYAIVDRLELDLTRGMTAITGETGAGKSILLGALGLCLGERADAGSVRHGCERTDLSARFDIQHLPAAAEWLDARELPADECLLRRVVTANGRSKAWINGHPATIADLKSLGEQLIQIHGQHAHQALMREETHLALLDDYAGLRERSQQLAETFREWRSARRRLKKLSEEGSEVEAKRQLLRYQVEELDQLVEPNMSRCSSTRTCFAWIFMSLFESSLASTPLVIIHWMASWFSSMWSSRSTCTATPRSTARASTSSSSVVASPEKYSHWTIRTSS